MHPAVPHRLFDRLTWALVVVVIAVSITLLELGHPTPQELVDRLEAATGTKTAAPVTTPAKSQPKPVAKPAPAPVPAVAAPQPAPAAAPATKTAITNSFVHLRAAKSTSSDIILNLNAGSTVQLRDDADATWQGVTYQGKDGFIYRAYLQYQPSPTSP